MQKLNILLKPLEKEKLEQELMVSFQEELKEPSFRELVDKLGLSYEVLAKYTSILKVSALQYQHCKKCKGLLSCQNEVPGCAYLPKVENQQVIFCYKACRYQLAFEEQTAYQKNIALFEVPKELKNASMKQIFTEDKNRFAAIKWLGTFVKEYPTTKKGLYLYGSFGSGKTYLVAAAFNELAKKGVKSAMVFWPEFLRSLKSSFGNDFSQIYNRVKKAPLLLIDDIGAETSTAWSRDEILCPILQYRMQEHLPTFFTSNLDLKGLEQHFSMTKDGVEQVKAKRLMERMIQLTEEVSLISKNLRQ